MQSCIIIVLRFFVVSVISFFLLPLSASSFNNKSLSDTCKSKRSKTFYLQFSLDTATSDFYHLLAFIESKAAVSRFGPDHKEDSSTARMIVLKKVLCWEKLHQSPIEYWKLSNVFSISYYLQSAHVASASEDSMSFTLTQLNFTSQQQMETAAQKIEEIRWGEPLFPWNFWFLVRGNKRLYIIQTTVPGHIDTAEKYSNIIREEWVK